MVAAGLEFLCAEWQIRRPIPFALTAAAVPAASSFSPGLMASCFMPSAAFGGMRDVRPRAKRARCSTAPRPRPESSTQGQAASQHPSPAPDQPDRPRPGLPPGSTMSGSRGRRVVRAPWPLMLTGPGSWTSLRNRSAALLDEDPQYFNLLAGLRGNEVRDHRGRRLSPLASHPIMPIG